MVTEECCRLGIRYLTLFSFSTENWNRGPEEIASLMGLFQYYLDNELQILLENGIRLRAIGDLSRLPLSIQASLDRATAETRDNSRLDLVLAISYGGREEMVAATQRIAEMVKNGSLEPGDIDESVFCSSMWSAGIPDPDVLIRTSGEMRISNFLLWQLAYSELVVTETLWPDFDSEAFQRCIAEYSKRERRFGKTSEQLQAGVS